jgi:hypothetical protein
MHFRLSRKGAFPRPILVILFTICRPDGLGLTHTKRQREGRFSGETIEVQIQSQGIPVKLQSLIVLAVVVRKRFSFYPVFRSERRCNGITSPRHVFPPRSFSGICPDHLPSKAEIRRHLLRVEQEGTASRSEICPEKRGGLKGSMQHWPVVYSPEFQSPTSCVDAD